VSLFKLGPALLLDTVAHLLRLQHAATSWMARGARI
jgi:hypothetical protein